MDLFFSIALLGPLLAGLIAAALGRPWWYGALPFALYFGLWGLVHDWFLLDRPEDRVFHVVLTLVILGLAALGGLAGRALARRRSAGDRLVSGPGGPAHPAADGQQAAGLLAPTGRHRTR